MDRFEIGNEAPKSNVEFWGKKTGDTIYINKSVLENILFKSGFDFDACKKKWAEKGYIELYY